MKHSESRDQTVEETTISRMIKEIGPVVISETPFSKSGVTVSKHKYVHIHKPQAGNHTKGNAMQVGINHKGVIYHEENDYRDVVTLWLDNNELMMNESSSWAIYQTCTDKNTINSEMEDALKSVLKERDPDGWHPTN